MGLTRLVCNLQKQDMYPVLDREPNTKRDKMGDRHMQHNIKIYLWKVVHKGVRRLQNQTLLLTFAVMVMNIGFCF
jgi:hypothetical protein